VTYNNGHFYGTQYSKTRRWSTSQIKPSMMEGHFGLIIRPIDRSTRKNNERSPALVFSQPHRTPPRVDTSLPCTMLPAHVSSPPRSTPPCPAPRRCRSTPPCPAPRHRRLTHVRLAVGSPPLRRHRSAAGQSLHVLHHTVAGRPSPDGPTCDLSPSLKSYSLTGSSPFD
jgi:hypothetical protein